MAANKKHFWKKPQKKILQAINVNVAKVFMNALYGKGKIFYCKPDNDTLTLQHCYL